MRGAVVSAVCEGMTCVFWARGLSCCGAVAAVGSEELKGMTYKNSCCAAAPGCLPNVGYLPDKKRWVTCLGRSGGSLA